MCEHTLLKRTVIEEADFLEVGIAVCVYQEKHADYSHLYTQNEVWMGFNPDIKLITKRIYLEGTIEGLHQIVKIELPHKAVEDEELVNTWNEYACEVSKALKHNIKLAALVEFGKGLIND